MIDIAGLAGVLIDYAVNRLPVPFENQILNRHPVALARSTGRAAHLNHGPRKTGGGLDFCAVGRVVSFSRDSGSIG